MSQSASSSAAMTTQDHAVAMNGVESSGLRVFWPRVRSSPLAEGWVIGDSSGNTGTGRVGVCPSVSAKG